MKLEAQTPILLPLPAQPMVHGLLGEVCYWEHTFGNLPVEIMMWGHPDIALLDHSLTQRRFNPYLEARRRVGIDRRFFRYSLSLESYEGPDAGWKLTAILQDASAPSACPALPLSFLIHALKSCPQPETSARIPVKLSFMNRQGEETVSHWLPALVFPGERLVINILDTSVGDRLFDKLNRHVLHTLGLMCKSDSDVDQWRSDVVNAVFHETFRKRRVPSTGLHVTACSGRLTLMDSSGSEFNLSQLEQMALDAWAEVIDAAVEMGIHWDYSPGYASCFITHISTFAAG